MELISGNIFIRPMRFEKAGDVVEGHTHNFAHTTYIVRGTVQIDQLDSDGSVMRSVLKRASDGQNWVLIKPDACHRLTALEDNSLGHCIYAHRTPQGDVVQEYDGWMAGYV